MARLSFSKASLHRQSAALKRYRQYLPSLDLKRKQLIAERAKAAERLATIDSAMQNLRQRVAEQLPMLSDEAVDLAQLVRIDAVVFEEINVVGVHLPAVRDVKLVTSSYSFMTKPHWVDQTVRLWSEMLELRVRRQTAQQQWQLLDHAVKKVTQRVNLFDKVLIPRTRDNIRRISIFLSDAERAGVVRAKITKHKSAHKGG